MSRIFNTTLIDRKVVAENTLEISFKRPNGFSFKAGQYIQLDVLELLYSDPKGTSRVFSITSSPLDQEKISVAWRDTGSGFKRTLKELPSGALVKIEGPHGFFTLPENSPRPIVFVAGGIGITPYLSMVRYVTEKKKLFSFPITLLYANRSRESAAYLTELEDMTNRNDNFTMKNKYGRTDEEFIRQNIKNTHQCVWYIAGPPDMVDSTRNLLFLLGIDDGRICLEEFMGY